MNKGIRIAISVLTLLTICVARADQTPEDRRLSFVADRKAFRVGDALTVLIAESATASATARTRVDKEEKANASLQARDRTVDQWGVALGSGFEGGGQIERSGRLLAKIAVEVERVDGNGKLFVRGEQEITVNNERQRIRLEGFVRPEDILPDNTVPSWRVSAAQIDFLGKGVLARGQSPGLFTRILTFFKLN